MCLRVNSRLNSGICFLVYWLFLDGLTRPEPYIEAASINFQ